MPLWRMEFLSANQLVTGFAVFLFIFFDHCFVFVSLIFPQHVLIIMLD